MWPTCARAMWCCWIRLGLTNCTFPKVCTVCRCSCRAPGWASGCNRLRRPARAWPGATRDGARALGALAVQLARYPASAQALPPALLSDHLGALLCAALEPPQPPAPTAARSLHAHLCALLRARVDQPGLSAQALAQEAGVSLRTLHRAFAAQGHTFAGTLRELRLARAGELLRRPQLAHVAVGEIGRRCGFADPSHFARAFQRAMGVSPAQWRRGG